MKFLARLYLINKGKNVQNAYFSTIKKREIEKLDINADEAFLLEIKDKMFPTKIRKLKTGQGRFMLGFTVPYEIGSLLSPKTDHNFILLSKNTKKEDNSIMRYNVIDLKQLLPTHTITDKPLFLFDYKGFLFVWIYSKGNKLIKVPKEISIIRNGFSIFEVVGAFFCEGLKARKLGKHRDRFSFSNADKEQIEWFVSACEVLLGIKRSAWSVQILYPKNDQKNVKKVKNYWLNVGFLPEKLEIYQNEKTNDFCGVCIINIYNSSLAETFYYLAKYCQERALESEVFAEDFFRGLSRGDLGVSSSKTDVISFTTESLQNMKYFKSLCEVLGISINKYFHDNRGGGEGCWNVYITHRKNIRKIVELGLITHSKRKIRLYRNFLKARKSRYFEYLYAVSNGDNTVKKAADELMVARITSTQGFLKLLRQGFLYRRRESYYYVYSLSEKGKEALEFYDSVRASV